MKKFAMILFTFILAASLMAGCRGNSDQTNSTPTDTLESTGSTVNSLPMPDNNTDGGNDTGMAGQIIGR